MEKPDIKDYQYSDGEMRDLVAYTEILEDYVKYLESKAENLPISNVRFSLPSDRETEILLNAISAFDPTRADAMIEDMRQLTIKYTNKVEAFKGNEA